MTKIEPRLIAANTEFTFSLSPVGFAAQTSFTLEQYRDVTLAELAAAEPADPRFWWQRRTT